MASKMEVLPEPLGPTIKLIGRGRLSKSVKSYEISLIARKFFISKECSFI